MGILKSAATAAPPARPAKKPPAPPCLKPEEIQEDRVYKSETTQALYQVARLTAERIWFYRPTKSQIGQLLDEPIHSYLKPAVAAGAKREMEPDFCARHRIHTAVECRVCKAPATQVLVAKGDRKPLCQECVNAEIQKAHKSARFEAPAAPLFEAPKPKKGGKK